MPWYVRHKNAGMAEQEKIEKFSLFYFLFYGVFFFLFSILMMEKLAEITHG
jgi:hypothetical protein